MKLKLESGNMKGRVLADQLTSLQMACSKNKLEKNKEEKEFMATMDRKKEQEHQHTSPDMDSSSVDGELLLWNSLLKVKFEQSYMIIFLNNVVLVY